MTSVISCKNLPTHEYTKQKVFTNNKKAVNDFIVPEGLEFIKINKFPTIEEIVDALREKIKDFRESTGREPSFREFVKMIEGYNILNPDVMFAIANSPDAEDSDIVKKHAKEIYKIISGKNICPEKEKELALYMKPINYKIPNLYNDVNNPFSLTSQNKSEIKE